MRLDLDIQKAAGIGGVPAAGDFRRWAEAALAGRRESCEVALRIVGEEESRQFNRMYRKCDQATNVLSFPADLPPGLPQDVRAAVLGDIMICAPLVAREAAQLGVPEPHHWAHLLIHGLLHLLGYEHDDETEARRMESLETKILAGLGIADPYAIPLDPDFSRRC
jgi:probable rRNA maturation factor